MSEEAKTETLKTPESRVGDYLSASNNGDPFLYPGQRPEGSYLTDGETVYSMDPYRSAEGGLDFSITTNSGEVPVDQFLLEHGAPSLKERIPMLAFGANVCPGSLAKKMSVVGREDAMIVPTAYTKLHGYDVVWSGGPGVNGNFVAILYDGPESQDTDVQVAVNFLTREQLLVLHATELSYDIAWVNIQIEGVEVRAFYYVGRDSIYLKDGLPVAIESIPADNRDIEASDTKGLLQELLANESLMSEVVDHYPELQGANVEDYVDVAARLKLEKSALKLKSFVHERISKLGLSRFVEPNGAASHKESWANPSTLPSLGDQFRGVFHSHTYRLPSEELGEWGDPEARAKVLSSITTHLVRSSGKQLEATK